MATPPKDSRIKQAGRVAATTGLGALAGRVAAWHPVHGGRMNRGTLIGAGLGAAVGLGAEKLSKRFEGDDKRMVRKSGVVAAGLGAYAATARASVLAQEDAMKDMSSDFDTRMRGRVSEEDAARQNAKARRSMGFEGETFIPRMPRLARQTAKKAGFKIVTEDQTGGTMEDKLTRLHKSAKGTPEGDAALRKLNELRQRQGMNFTGKVKKVIKSVTSRFTPKKASKFAGHLLSAREQLDEIIHFKIQINPENKGKFTATEERTGKTTDELAESKNPLTRKRAIFARNMRKIAAKHKAEKTEMSARDALNSIIELKEVDLGHTYENYPSLDSSMSKSKKSYPCLYVNDREQDIDLPLEGTAKVRYKLKSKTIRQDDAGKKRHSADIEIQSIDPITEVAKNLIQGKPALLMSARDQLDNLIEFGTIKFGPAVGKGITEAIEEIMRRNGPTVTTRGNILKRALPNFPPPMGGGGMIKHGFIQKEAADALRKLRGKGPEFLTQGLSGRDKLDEIIRLSDPRPRNDLGMFTNTEEGAPNPNQIDSVYKQPARTIGQNLAGGAVAGAGAFASGGALRALVNKIKKARAS